MARSKEEKTAFIAHLRAAAKSMEESGVKIPSNLGRSYSLQNCLMILFQKPSATQCAGFHAWREAGRAVRKGAKGAAILVPLGVSTNEEGEDKPIFSWRYVFDINDTDPIAADSPATLKELVSA